MDHRHADFPKITVRWLLCSAFERRCEVAGSTPRAATYRNKATYPAPAVAAELHSSRGRTAAEASTVDNLPKRGKLSSSSPSRNRERGEKAVAEIRASGGKADFIASDLRDTSCAREVARRTIELGSGCVDILINNAGIFPFGPTDKTTEEEFDRVFSLNVKAPYFLVVELAPLMAKRINLPTRGAAG